MAVNNLSGTTYCQTLTCGSFTPPNGCITDAAVEAGADIDTSKLMHRFYPMIADPHTTTTVAERKVVHVVQATAAAGSNINLGYVGVTTAATTGVINVDVFVDGSTCLVTPAVINSSVAAYQLVAFDISNATVASGQVIEIVVTVESGTPNCAGFFAVLQVDEFPS